MSGNPETKEGDKIKVSINGDFKDLGFSNGDFHVYINFTWQDGVTTAINTISVNPYGYTMGDVEVTISNQSFDANTVTFHASITWSFKLKGLLR